MAANDFRRKIKFCQNGCEIVNENNGSNFTSFLKTIKDIQKVTIARSVMHQLLDKTEFRGNVIDIGGGENVSYKKIFNNCNYTSVNIDQKINPDLIVKVGEKINLSDSSFDFCLMFNLLEHVYDWNLLLNESYRLLKKDGKLIVLIPFMYPIHGSPQDYIRATHSFIKQKLTDSGFKKINIFSITYGPFTTSHLIGFGRLLKYINSINVILDKILKLIYPDFVKRYAKNAPLFYLVEGIPLK